MSIIQQSFPLKIPDCTSRQPSEGFSCFPVAHAELLPSELLAWHLCLIVSQPSLLSAHLWGELVLLPLHVHWGGLAVNVESRIVLFIFVDTVEACPTIAQDLSLYLAPPQHHPSRCPACPQLSLKLKCKLVPVQPQMGQTKYAFTVERTGATI